MQKTGRGKLGFTIVELLVVIVVIGVLAAIVFVSFGSVQRRSRVATIQSDLRNAATQLEINKAESDAYPASQALANLKPSQGLHLHIFLVAPTAIA